jgi:hypothetical protein
VLDVILNHGTDPDERDLRHRIAEHVRAVRASAGRCDRNDVIRAEDAVRADPSDAFIFDVSGRAILRTGTAAWQAGQFETVSLRSLENRAKGLKTAQTNARAKLWVFDGASPVTDIGSLQATSGEGTLFQVASQFNCLESPGRYVTRVCNYVNDYTQGPRASISAFPGTLLRHYSAPGLDGNRFIQKTDGSQIDLLEEVFGQGLLNNGYFTGEGIADPTPVVGLLETNFDLIRVGVHDGVQVVLGYDWDGAVINSDNRLISQVFTSTVAGGVYGGQERLGSAFDAACILLLRAAYFGTLLAAVCLGRSRVVLTLIGGGVFGNPITRIWQAIVWSVEKIRPFLNHDIDVVLNGYSLGSRVHLEEVVLPTVRNSGGAILRFDASGVAAFLR